MIFNNPMHLCPLALRNEKKLHPHKQIQMQQMQTRQQKKHCLHAHVYLLQLGYFFQHFYLQLVLSVCYSNGRLGVSYFQAETGEFFWGEINDNASFLALEFSTTAHDKTFSLTLIFFRTSEVQIGAVANHHTSKEWFKISW